MTRNTRSTKSLATLTGVLAASALALGGCSAGGSAAGDYDTNEAVQLEMSWWGDDARAALFGEVIDAFQVAHPNITVKRTPVGAPDDLFNRLATDFAAGADTAPDVFALGGAKPQEYGSLGALLDLSTVSEYVDYGNFPDFSLTNAMYDEKLYGLPTGGNATAAYINTDIFEQAGVAVPEEGWTWADLIDAANAIGSAKLTNESGKSIMGIDLRIQDIIGTYAGQVAEVGMYDWDGKVGVSAEDMTGWYEIEQQLADGGGLPDPSIVTANWQLPPDQQPFTLGQAAVTFGYSNLMSAYAGAGAVTMMLPPSDTDNSGVALLPSAFWSVNAATKHPEASALLVDWFLNEPSAAELILDTRGVPFTPEALAAVSPKLDEAGQIAAEYVNVVLEKGVVAPPQPNGSSIMNELSQRMESDLLFGSKTPAEAGQRWVADLEAAVG